MKQSHCNLLSEKPSRSKEEREGFFQKLSFWFHLNFYAILGNLFLIVYVILFLKIPFLKGGWLRCAVQAVILLPVCLAVAHIYADYPLRRRIYFTLLRRNRRTINPESFADFMTVPCHRKVCFEVLKTLNQKKLFPVLKKKYGVFLDYRDLQGYRKIYPAERRPE